MTSSPLTIELSKQHFRYKKATITVEEEGIDFNQEAILALNKKYSVFIPAGKGVERQKVQFNIDMKHFQEGKNYIQFGYFAKDENVKKDKNKGFVVYDFGIQFNN